MFTLSAKRNASNITLKWKSNCGDSVFLKDSKRAERIFLGANVSKNKNNQRYKVYTITIKVFLANAQKIIPFKNQQYSRRLHKKINAPVLSEENTGNTIHTKNR